MPTDTKVVNPEDMLGRILCKAIDGRASDIHLEPSQDGIKIYFRIDGLLYLNEDLGTYSQDKLISRIKVLSEMDIAERRLPQEGGFEFTYKDRAYNIRASTLPTPRGEAIVFRILNRESILMELEGLGFEQNQLQTMIDLIGRPYGMILLTGPVGSGKTTLLYSIINRLNRSEINIVTLEDPIEFHLPNVRQVQISETVGLDFVKAMKSVLRQDPDIIMLGEIRDLETAEIAMQAALSGVLVLSTFHTLDVPGVVTRLVEMGVPRSVVAQAIMGIISTRLVGKVCDSCAELYQPNDYEKKFLGSESATGSFRKGNGCSACRNSGYLGRIGVFEVVHFDNEIRSWILEKKFFTSLYELLAEKGIKTLREAALEKARRGIISIERALRVV